MDKYALFGNPVGHSLSPTIHAMFARATAQQFDYVCIQPPIGHFQIALQHFVKNGGVGANVTFPFKIEAYAAAHQHSEAARVAEAASCFVVQPNGMIYADNYDGCGLVTDLARNHAFSLRQKTILIIGGGGAVRGILGAILAAMPEHVIIANRTVTKAMALAARYKANGQVSVIALNKIAIRPYDLIVHATTAGHQGSLVPLPTGIIDEHTWCYDISYGQAARPFLRWAKSQGSRRCIDGLGMLVEHNAAVFQLWRHIHPSTSEIIQMLRAKHLH